MLTCSAIVITCMDYRFQNLFEQWLDQQIGQGQYDRVALAGAAKDARIVLSQVEIAHRLHAIERVVLINHEQCGAYGPQATLEDHTRDLQSLAQAIRKRFPDLTVDLYYARLPVGEVLWPDALMTPISEQ